MGPHAFLRVMLAALPLLCPAGQDSRLAVSGGNRTASLDAVVNAASFLPGPVAPGEIVTLFGAGLGPGELVWMTLGPDGRVSRSLAGVRVLFDGEPASLVYVLAKQTSAVVPYGVAGKTAVAVEVERDGQKTNALAVSVAPSAPGIFTAGATGSGQGAIVNLDGSLNGPSNPVQAGSYVSVYMTGEGQTDPPGEDGKLAAAPLPRPLLNVKARVGAIEAEVQYAGGAPGYLAGLMQVNVRVPPGVTPGPAVPITITAGDTSSQPGVTLAVAPPPTQASPFYLFDIDLDRLGGAPDFSFLNQPLGPSGRLFARDGHFFRVGADLKPNTADDERVRLFGVNLAFGANFPAEVDATRIAKRLRRLGVNLVRLHHMDSWPDARPEDANSLLTTRPYPALNDVTVRRMRAFLDALKAEGIYVNLNLHVGYEFRPSIDQVPVWPGPASMPSQSKPLHIFYPRMVDLQVEYVRRVIAALALQDDPVLGMVEISNESSLVFSWQTPWGESLDDVLKGEYRTELQRQWNRFLQAKYASTSALAASWGRGELRGPDLLPGAWILEVHLPAQAKLSSIQTDGIPTAKVEVSRGGNWVFAKETGFSLSSGEIYAAELEIRADLPAGSSQNADWSVMEDVSPWRWITGRSLAVTGQWQKFKMVVRPSFSVTGAGRFMVNVQDFAGVPVYIRNCKLQTTAGAGLAQGESLEAGGISLVPSSEVATDARTNDYLDFLVETDRAYLNRMLGAVREAATAPVQVTGTQMGYGGLLNFDSHRDLDYFDDHFYTDHYDFPNQPWDPRDWRIRNISSVGEGLEWYTNIAASRHASRPYTVSEFNQPWPNTQGAEIDPVVAALGAFQDWDAVVHFAFSHSRNWDARVPGGFNLVADSTKLPVAGLSAWLFRTGAVETGRNAVLVPVSRATRLASAKMRRPWDVSGSLRESAGYEPAIAFVHPVRLLPEEGGAVPEEAKRKPQAPYLSDTGELAYDPGARTLTIAAPRVAGVIGFTGTNKVRAGALEVQLAPGSSGFAAILAGSLDGKPLADSRRLLLAVPGAALRTQPRTAPPRPQKLINYPGTSDWWTLEPAPDSAGPSGHLDEGQGPVYLQRMECFVTLGASAAAIRVYPLDGTGARMAALDPACAEHLEGGFRLRLHAEGQNFSPWYELVLE